jgi:hypothetical protein
MEEKEEFESDEENTDYLNIEKPIDAIVERMGKNKFVFDPENGGGRRRRIKKVSRIQML